MRWTLLFLLLSGCAVALRGTVTNDDGRTSLAETSGDVHTLRLRSTAQLLRFMEGELVDLEGSKSMGRVTVRNFRVLESSAGLPVWLGLLQERRGELGLVDYMSGGWFSLERDVFEEMAPFVGAPVLVEGYVEGAHTLRVVHYRVLVDGES